MRRPNETIEEKQDRRYMQKEGDIFLKHDDAADSTAVVIRNSQVAAYTGEGKTGILIQDNGNIIIQGKVNLRTDSFNISRQTWPIVGGEVTENPLSTMPSTIYTQIPGYLRKMPELGMYKQVMDLLEKFIKI